MAQVTLTSRQLGLVKESVIQEIDNRRRFLVENRIEEAYPNICNSIKSEIAELEAALVSLKQAEPCPE